MKKFILPLIVIIVSVALLAVPALAEPQPAAQPLPAGTASPRNWDKLIGSDGSLKQDAVKGDSAILIDAKSGKVLYDKHSGDKWYPASTTKIMTCLLALESGKDLSDTVTVGTLPADDFASDSDNIGLKEGEQIKFEDLLGGMMVKSGNDAADAIAIYVGGSVDNFVDMMNQKAQELGMTGTHYTCSNGYSNNSRTHDTNHYTTARDMATLAREAIKNPEFVKLASSASWTIPATNKNDKRVYSSTNYLLGNTDYGYQYATGIKTGLTDMALNCLVSSAKQGDMSLIGVEMHTPMPRQNLWVDAVTMFEYGFQNYTTIDLDNLLSSQPLSADIKGAAGSDPDQGKLSLTLKPQTQEYMTDRTDTIKDLQDPSKFQQQVTITKDTAPIEQNEKVGTVTFSYNGKPVLTCDLLATRAVELATPAPSASLSPTKNASGASATSSPEQTEQTTGGLGSTVIWIAIVVLLLALVALLIRFFNMQRRNRKYSYRQGSGTRMRR